MALDAACSDTTDDVPEHAGEDPLYLAVTRVWNDVETTSYLHVVPSTLINLTADGGPKRELTLPGFLQNIARVR